MHGGEVGIEIREELGRGERRYGDHDALGVAAARHRRARPRSHDRRARTAERDAAGQDARALKTLGKPRGQRLHAGRAA